MAKEKAVTNPKPVKAGKLSTESQCQQYLFNLRWAPDKAHKCTNCGGQLEKYKAYHMRCTSCKTLFSPTSGTLFHHAKFKLPVLLSIVREHVVEAPKYLKETGEPYPHYRIGKKLDLPYPNVFAFRKNKLSKIKLKPGMTMDEYVTLALKHKKVEPSYASATPR